jgi:hypothetical protein
MGVCGLLGAGCWGVGGERGKVDEEQQRETRARRLGACSGGAWSGVEWMGLYIHMRASI